MPVLVAGAILVARSGSSEAVCDGASRVDRPTPAIEGPSVADGSHLRYEPGRVTVINVWGSWCGPCRVEQPYFARAARARPQVRFLGLDVQDNDAAGRAFMREFDVPYPSIRDPSRELSSRLRAFSTPATLVVDARGVIRVQVMGTTGADQLDCMIDLAGG